MKVFNCFYPKVIRNQYTGELVTCKCGKCPACRNARVSDWIMRLDLEATCHKYVVFCTLTYNEQNVSQFIRLRKEDYPTPAYINGESGEILDMLDIKENFTIHDKQYIYKNKVLNVLDKKDFQNFIKRLRYYFDQTDPGAKLRYYLCGEYGPSTFRPHGHCLFFFDSPKCAGAIDTLLRKSWQYGVLYDPHFVSGSAASYCAAYINSTSSLPKCYLHQSVKPFTLFSKSPAIGTNCEALSDVKEIFDKELITFRRFDKPSHSFKDEFIPKSLRNRLFPRLPRFSQLSNDDRTLLYRKVEEFPSKLNAREIAERLKAEYISRPNFSAVALYIKDIAFKKKYGIRLVPDKYVTKQQYKDFPFLPNFAIEVPFYAQKTVTKEFCFESLVRFARTLKRVQKNANMFHLSITQYSNKISSYYEKLEKERLKQDYLFQDEYFKTHPVSDFVYFDESFIDKVNKTDYNLLSDSTKFILNLYKVPLDVTGKYNLSRKKSRTYHDFVIFHNKIAHDLVKQKKTNDYVRSKKDKHGNIVQPLNI